MRLFLDTSVLLSAAGSTRGASRFLIAEAAAHGWELVSADYCAEEARRNLQKLGPSAATAWRETVELAVTFVGVRLALDKPLVFPKTKDRPVVITALAARCEWLLTLDETDFHGNTDGDHGAGFRSGSSGRPPTQRRQGRDEVPR